ncbi:MAG: alpha/beta fold hydrolase [Ramlibacter sp.]|nr:alpha/beta fold hydrolase [Ramlibacter sp.]
MTETFLQPLPHGITLSCRAAGRRGQPVMIFLHGFPEAAFVWDGLLAHFAAQGYRCVAPNLRGFEQSSAPAEVAAYRPKHLVQDIAALVAIESPNGPIDCLVAHDWGGAVAWNFANQLPHLAHRLAIVNSPHPGTFLRELKSNPRQQAASAYMNFLIRPDAERLLADNDFARMWPFFHNGSPEGAHWLTEPVKDQYRAVWRGAPGSAPGAGLTGGCNYYRASPLRPPRPEDPGAAAVDLPHAMLTVSLPTLVVWAMNDIALPPELIDGLGDYIPRLTLHKVEGASHWIVHEQPELVARLLGDFLAA